MTDIRLDHPAAIDMQARFRPSGQQVTVAKAMLAAEPLAEMVIVGIALPGKTRGVWVPGQTVRHAPGFWLASTLVDTGPLAYGHAREAAAAAAGAALDGPGSMAYAVIERDGSWAVFESFRGGRS